VSLEEEHQALHRRGEVLKFIVLVVILLLTVLVVAAVRPLIFEQIVPAVMGWEGSGDEPVDAVLPPATPEPTTVVPTATLSPTTTPLTTTLSATATPQTYQVQPGDNLTEIADRYGVSVQALIEANNLSNPNQLISGQRLTIPGD